MNIVYVHCCAKRKKTRRALSLDECPQPLLAVALRQESDEVTANEVVGPRVESLPGVEVAFGEAGLREASAKGAAEIWPRQTSTPGVELSLVVDGETLVKPRRQRAV